jgi:CMP-N-acetylneuraminic acid synthetase
VYGRQEPMIFSSSSDKRDLLITFGLDRKIQIRDSFFHNANSIFKKEIWKQISFDEKTKNIEDRLWAQKIINKGYNIVYTPKSSVYHYHGIHQDNNKKRLNNVVKIIEGNLKNYSPGRVDIKKLLIAAVIPTKGELQKYENKFKLEFTLQVIKKSNFIKKIFVSTDSNKNAKLIKQLGAIPIIRNKIYSSKNINIEQVQKYVLNQIDKKFDLDLFFHFEETFPFRDYRMLDKMINVIVDQGFDSVIAAKRDPGWLWMEKSNKDLLRIDEGDKPREEKNCTYIGLKGVGLVTYPEFIRKGNLLGNKIGMFEIYNQISQIEVRNYDDYKFFYKYLKNYNKK